MFRRTRYRFAVLAAAIVSALGAQVRAADDAQRLPKATGAWRIETAPDAESQQDNVALATAAIGDADATFSLWCRPAVPLYWFALRDARLKLPSGAEATLS